MEQKCPVFARLFKTIFTEKLTASKVIYKQYKINFQIGIVSAQTNRNQKFREKKIVFEFPNEILLKYLEGE